MSTFDDRERGYEARFAREQEFEFRVHTRAARTLGLWAAEKLGLTGAEAEEYAKAVVRADFSEPGWEDVVRKVKADFEAKNVDVSEHGIRRCMEEYIADARAGLEKEIGARD